MTWEVMASSQGPCDHVVMPTITNDFGSALKWWRTTRRFSQLELATEAGVSSRHLSFLETGKAHPSREMAIHLSVVLELPLRDRNALLHTAGFAPVYPQSELDSPEMGDIRGTLRAMLDAHLPSPAVIVDRCGDIVDANAAGNTLISAAVPPASPALDPAPNINRLTFHPEGIRNATENWDEVAANVLRRLERECAFRPSDDRLRHLLDEVMAYPNVKELGRGAGLPTGSDLVVPFRVTTHDGDDLELITMIATIGAPYDVTLDELRLETFFAVDDDTRTTLAGWAKGDELRCAAPAALPTSRCGRSEI